jgi:hypothetical protein
MLACFEFLGSDKTCVGYEYYERCTGGGCVQSQMLYGFWRGTGMDKCTERKPLLLWVWEGASGRLSGKS